MGSPRVGWNTKFIKDVLGHLVVAVRHKLLPCSQFVTVQCQDRGIHHVSLPSQYSGDDCT